jgi:rod shape-determining protein MreC
VKRLPRDPFERPITNRAPTLGSRWRSGMLLTLMFFSICLLVLSRLEHRAVLGVRAWTSEKLAPVLEAASVPAAAVTRLRQRVAMYMDLFVELDRLKLENQKLKQYVWRVQMMEAEVERYRGLLKGVREPNLDFVTARVIADSSGVFVRSVLINAGGNERVRDGHAVINGDGLVGRIVTSGETVARVLLLTDLNSRIPVMIGSLGARGVLHGDNGPRPALEHLSADSKIAAGDTVFTSGQDGVLPKGLKIGVVAVDGPTFVVEPFAGFEGLEYVSVLLFDGPSGTPDSTVPEEPPRASLAEE